jgi:hypothetical protein
VNRKKSRQRLGADNIVVAGKKSFHLRALFATKVGLQIAEATPLIGAQVKTLLAGHHDIVETEHHKKDQNTDDPVQFPRLFISSLKENPQRM